MPLIIVKTLVYKTISLISSITNNVFADTFDINASDIVKVVSELKLEITYHLVTKFGSLVPKPILDPTAKLDVFQFVPLPVIVVPDPLTVPVVYL